MLPQSAQGHEVEAGQGRRPLHRQRGGRIGGGNGEDHGRGKAFADPDRLAALEADRPDAGREYRRQHRIAGEAFDHPAVKPEAERPAAIDFGACEFVGFCCRQPVGLPGHAVTARSSGRT